MLRGHAQALAHGPSLRQLAGSAASGLRSSSSSSSAAGSSDHHHPPFLARSISALAIQRPREPAPDDGLASWPQQGTSAQRPDGLVWDLRRRAFKPREGKARQLAEPADVDADSVARAAQQRPRHLSLHTHPTLSPTDEQLLALEGALDASSAGPASSSLSPVNGRQGFAERRRGRQPAAAALLLPNDRSTALAELPERPIKVVFFPPPLPASVALRSPPAPPPPLSALLLPPSAASPAPNGAPASTYLIIHHPHHHDLDAPTYIRISPALREQLRGRLRPPSQDSSTRDAQPPSELRAVSADDVDALVRALGAGLAPYLPSPTAPAASSSTALAKECAAVIRRCLEDKQSKSPEESYWLTRADLALQGDMDLAHLVSCFRNVSRSPHLKHSLPVLYAVVRSADPTAGPAAAGLLALACSSLDLSTRESRQQLLAVYRAILRRLAADEGGAEGLQPMLSVLKSCLAKPGFIEPDFRVLSTALLDASRPMASSDVALDLCAQLVSEPVLLPSSSALARLGLSSTDPELAARLLCCDRVSKRHCALVVDSLLDRLGGGAHAYDTKAKVADILCRSARAHMVADHVDTPVVQRLLAFLSFHGQARYAALVVARSADRGDMQEATALLAAKIVLKLSSQNRAKGFPVALRLFAAMPVAHQVLPLFNALIRSANRCFPTREAAEAAAGKVEKMLAQRTDLAPDVETIEARLHAPPRSSDERPARELSPLEKTARFDGRQQTYDELYAVALEHGTSFRRETWHLVLAAAGRGCGDSRALEVLDWMALHGFAPDMATFNTVLQNALFAEGRTGQATIKVFNSCLTRLLREEPTFQPDIETFINVARAFVPCSAHHFAAEPLRELFDFYARRTDLPCCPPGGLLGLPTPAPLPQPPPVSSTWPSTAASPPAALPQLTFTFPPELDFDRHVRGVYDLFLLGFQRRRDHAAVDALALARRQAIEERRRDLRKEGFSDWHA